MEGAQRDRQIDTSQAKSARPKPIFILVLGHEQQQVNVDAFGSSYRKQRDKRPDFSHRGADEKSRLDEAVRRGMGGASGLAMAGAAAERRISGSGPVSPARMHGLCAQHLRSRVLAGSKTRGQNVTIGVSG